MSRSRITVMHLVNRWEVGGVRRHILHLVNEMQGSGVRSMVAAWTPPQSPVPGDVPFVRLPMYSLSKGRRSIVGYLKAIGILRSSLKAQSVDILHVHARLMLPLSQIACRGLRTRRVATVHSTFSDLGWLPYPETVICVSEEVRRIFLEYVHTAKTKRCSVIPNGARLDRQAGWEPHPEGFVYVGRLEREKGVETLIRAVARLRDLPACSLTIVGDGAERRMLETLSEELGVRSRVRFHGIQVDVSRFITDAVASVLPSVALEGFGYAALESLVCGRPVIASDLPVFDDLVRHGETGLRFRRGDDQDLSAQLRRMLSEPSLARMMGSNGRELARERFSLDRMISDTLGVYRTLLDTAKEPLGPFAV